MPGPVSDSYDPVWGTGANRDEIDEALQALYRRISGHLEHRSPIYILELVRADLPERSELELSEQEWRILRFALERARDCL